MIGSRRFRFGLVTRILTSSAAFALLGVALAAMLASTLMAGFWLRQALSAESRELASIVADCQAGAAPNAPLLRGPLKIELFDAATLAPRTEGARLDMDFKRRLAEGARRSLRLAPPLGVGSKGFRLVGGAQSCGLIQYTVMATPLRRSYVFGPVAAAGVLAALLGAVGAYWIAAKPFLRRVAAASVAARRIGATDYLAHRSRGRSGEWRDLDQILRSMDEADARIKSDIDLLETRAREIERMTGAIAHDLKTPLAAMQLHLARAQTPERGQPVDREAINLAIAEVQYAASLLENLEVAAQLRAKMAPPEPSRVDLCDIVRRTHTRFRALGALRNVEVEATWPDGPVEAAADPVLCERLLANLVHNAIRHGVADGHVAIVLEASEGGFALCVVDDGPGFPPEVLARLKSEASLEIAPTRIIGGGIGLPIVTTLARLMNFSVTFQNEPAGGATVVITGALA